MLNLQCWAHKIFLAFALVTTRQRNKASGTIKNSKNVKVSVSRWSCQNESSKMQNSTTLRPENMVTLSRQCCRVPSSANNNIILSPISSSSSSFQFFKHKQRRLQGFLGPDLCFVFTFSLSFASKQHSTNSTSQSCVLKQNKWWIFKIHQHKSQSMNEKTRIKCFWQ